MNFVGAHQGVKRLLEGREYSCYFFSRDPFGEFFEIFETDCHIFGDEFGSLPQICDSFNANIVKLLCFFGSDSPNLF